MLFTIYKYGVVAGAGIWVDPSRIGPRDYEESADDWKREKEEALIESSRSV